jgi:hypothetical protein
VGDLDDSSEMDEILMPPGLIRFKGFLNNLPRQRPRPHYSTAQQYFILHIQFIMPPTRYQDFLDPERKPSVLEIQEKMPVYVDSFQVDRMLKNRGRIRG